jgi:hypothetical protein
VTGSGRLLVVSAHVLDGPVLDGPVLDGGAEVPG